MSYSKIVSPFRVSSVMLGEFEHVRRVLSKREGKVVPKTEVIRRAIGLLPDPSDGVQIKLNLAERGSLTEQMPQTRVTKAQYAKIEALMVHTMHKTGTILRSALELLIEQELEKEEV